MTDYPTGVKPSAASKKPYNGAAHTPKSSKGLGDYYGTGIVAKLGRVRSGMGQEILSTKKLAKSPKSVV